MSLVVIVTLNLCNLRLLLVVAKFLVEHLEEDGKYRVIDILAKTIVEFLNVEEYAFGRYFTSLLNLTLQLKDIACFLSKDVGTRTTFDNEFVLKNVRKYLQQV